MSDDDNGNDEGNQGDDNNDGGNKGDGGGGDSKTLLDGNKITSDDDNKGDGDADGGDDKGDGEGDDKTERPEYLEEKFWDEEKGEVKLELLHKNYKGLVDKMAKGDHKAPEEYSLDGLNDEVKAIFKDGDAENDPIFKWFQGYAKENNFSQDMFDKAIMEYAEEAQGAIAADAPAEIDLDAEREKLGDNSTAIIEDAERFYKQLFSQGHINKDQLTEGLLLVETADGVNFLNAIRNFYGDKQNIPLNLTPGDGAKSDAELQKMVNDPKYGSDTQYTADVDAQYAKRYGEDPAMSSSNRPL